MWFFFFFFVRTYVDVLYCIGRCMGGWVGR